VGDKRGEPEFIYLVDINAHNDLSRVAKFLESDVGSPWSVQAWDNGVLVERPGVYTDRFGSWMTSYAPIRNTHGEVVALMGLDFEADEVAHVRRELFETLTLVFVVAYLAVISLTYLAATLLMRPLTRLAGAAGVAPPPISEPHPQSSKREPELKRTAMTVLRVEIVGLAELSNETSALGVQRSLSEAFARFDRIAHKNGLDRIETRGDTYTLVGGSEVDDVRAVVSAALDIVADLHDLVGKGSPLGIRAGVHTGTVVTEVEHRGELWGDVVHVGGRLESLGERDRVHVSAAVAKAVEHSFVVEEREAKAGDTNEHTFWIVRRRV
jgi:class 3 adenylate cyclase